MKTQPAIFIKNRIELNLFVFREFETTRLDYHLQFHGKSLSFPSGYLENRPFWDFRPMDMYNISKVQMNRQKLKPLRSAQV